MKPKAVAAVVLLLAFMGGLNWELGICAEDQMRTNTPSPAMVPVLAHWSAALPGDVGGFSQYLQGLARKRDFHTLKTIYESDLPYASWAAREATLAIGPTGAVAFCQTFESGSPNWEASFSALGHYNKMVVMGYIKRMARSPEPFVRCLCYRLCLSNGWNGLVEEAGRDLTDKSSFLLPNQTDPMVLGDLARKYWTEFKETSRDHPRPEIQLKHAENSENGWSLSDVIVVLRPDSSFSTKNGEVVNEEELSALIASHGQEQVVVRIVLADERRTAAPEIYKAVCTVIGCCTSMKRVQIISPTKWE